MCTILDDLINERYENGVEKGIEKGIKQGERTAKIETAKKMINKGFDYDEISELTGLSVSDVQGLTLN